MKSSDERLQVGIAAYKQGRKEDAGLYIKQALQLDPKNERAWLWLSGVVESDEQRRDCLVRVLAINPENKVARLGLVKLTAEPEKAIRPSLPPEPERQEPPPPTPPEEPQAAAPSTSSEAAPAPAEQKNGRGRVPIIIGIGLGAILVILIGYFFFLPALSPFFLSDELIVAQELTPEEESAVISAVYENIAAANSENIDRYMDSLHTQTRNFQSTRETLETLYRDYDLTVTISGVEITHYSTAEARVSFTLETRKRNGPDFRDNRISGTFILRPEDGVWKLYEQEVEKIVYLD